MNRFQRRNQARILDRKIPAHQKAIVGKAPVRERELIECGGDTVRKQILECAAIQPIVLGFPKDSQTAIVMAALKKYGAENARL